MGRKRSAANADGELLDPDEQAPVPARARRPHGGDRDPREVLGTGVVDDPPAIPETPKRSLEDLSSRYARALVAFAREPNQIAKALAEVYGITVQEAGDRMVELHEKIRGAVRTNMNVGDMIERHDVSIEVRIARTREMVFSADDRTAIRAIEMLNDMDATAKSKRIGNTWETFVRRAREKAALKMAEKRKKAS